MSHPTTVPYAPPAPRHGHPVVALAAVVLGAAAVVGLYLLAVVEPTGRAADEAVMRAAMSTGADLRGEMLALLELVGVPSVVLAVVALAGIALLRGRGARAVGVVAVVAGAQVVTQLLKAGLPRPGDGLGNSLPSGHVTLVASLGVALVLVAPRALRPLAVACAATVTTLAGAATMVAGWHRPSDVAAAVAVVVATTGVVALFSRGLSRPPSAAPRSVVPAPRSGRDGAGRPPAHPVRTGAPVRPWPAVR